METNSDASAWTTVLTIVNLVFTAAWAAWTYFDSKRHTKEVEHLKSELAEKSALNDARRVYEFDAKKRLYQEYEPLFFQLIEQGKNAHYKVKNLARDARNGELEEKGWSSRPGYYVKNTIYKIIAPAALFKISQMKLTFVDLKLDAAIEARFHLSKLAYLLLTEDYTLAACDPKLDYDPNHRDWERLVGLSPEKFVRQGLPIGILDRAIEFFITKDENGEKLITYHEFERICDETPQKVDFLFQLFLDFHPLRRPILWRILMAQAIVFRELVNTSSETDLSTQKVMSNLKDFKLENESQFYVGLDERQDQELMRETLQSIRGYFNEVLDDYFSYSLK